MSEGRDLLLAEGGAGGNRAVESALQHGATTFVARLQATGAANHLAEGNGAWRYGKRCAFPTSPHPRLRLRTRFEKCATLTFHLVQKIGQVPSVPSGGHSNGRRPNTRRDLPDLQSCPIVAN